MEGFKFYQKWRKKLGKDNLFILVLIGLLFLVISFPSGKEEKDGEVFSVTGNTEQKDTNTEKELNMDSMDYCIYLEDKLEEILRKMEGVGDVKVMVTVSDLGEVIVEKEKEQEYAETNEKDAEGGERVISTTQSKEATIYTEIGSNKEPFIVQTILPKVEGVVVVAQGAGTGKVNNDIVKMVQALFDLEAHKIKVVKMNK